MRWRKHVSDRTEYNAPPNLGERVFAYKVRLSYSTKLVSDTALFKIFRQRFSVQFLTEPLFEFTILAKTFIITTTIPMDRRSFIEKTAAMGFAGLVAPTMSNASERNAQPLPRMIKDDISLAQWALVDEVRAGKWKTTDFARVAKEDFGINGIEYVNTLMEVPTEGYLRRLKKAAEDHGVTNVLIMVDDEGDGCMHSKEGRRQFAINHRKWIDAAQYLGCHAIRTNCRGSQVAQKVSKEESLKWAVESYNMLLEYAIPAKISVVIENHGGLSNDADWMVALIEQVDNLYFGSYPDWREPAANFDNYQYLLKMLPFAKGMSYRNQPTEELSAKMIRLSKDSGYRGWYGIESSGREAIKKGKELLTKYLFS
jgi:L-ribulose-5-phosphate 3-epimerase